MEIKSEIRLSSNYLRLYFNPRLLCLIPGLVFNKIMSLRS